MKGIILAGGHGARLHPMTLVVSKQLLPIYDKPMIYYPLSTLMLAGIRDVLLISNPTDLPSFQRLLKDGAHLGINIQYAAQPAPGGLAQAFMIGADYIEDDRVALILGDNLFYGQGFRRILNDAANSSESTVFACYVTNPERYGVVEFDANGKAISLEEKPRQPKGNFVVPGLYFYSSDVVDIARKLKPSSRGELEITDINKTYLNEGRLQVATLSRGVTWFDTGTKDSFLDACNFVAAVEKRQGLKICCVEEVAYNLKLIDEKQLLLLSEQFNNDYGEYLRRIPQHPTSGQ